jgi:hypothetical protein
MPVCHPSEARQDLSRSGVLETNLRVSLKATRLGATPGSIMSGIGLLAISPERRVPKPYLAPYGYLAVNETRVAAHSGRNVA